MRIVATTQPEAPPVIWNGSEGYTPVSCCLAIAEESLSSGLLKDLTNGEAEDLNRRMRDLAIYLRVFRTGITTS